MSTYKAADTDPKRTARKKIVTALKVMNLKDIHAVTFPADNFLLEKRLLLNYHTCIFHTIEKDPNVFNEQVHYVESNHLDNIYDLNIGEAKKIYKGLSKRTIYPLNFIWIDICGCFRSWIYFGTLLLLRQKKFQNRGVFAFTIRNGRESNPLQAKMKNLRDKVIKKSPNFDIMLFKRCELVPTFKALFKSYGYNCTSDVYYYSTSKKGNSMIMYTFRIYKPHLSV